MRFITQYPHAVYEVGSIPLDKIAVTTNCIAKGNEMRKTVHFRGDSVAPNPAGTEAYKNAYNKSINASMTPTEARLLGHELLAAANRADAQGAALQVKLDSERRERKADREGRT